MASFNTLCIDLQLAIETIEILRKVPGAEACISTVGQEELERIWSEQAERGMVDNINKEAS